MTLQFFFTDKTKTISSQFSPSLTQDLQPTRSTAQTPIFSFCPLTEAEVSKLLLSSHPTTYPLDQIPSHFSKQSLPHSYQHSHTLSTQAQALLTGIFPTAFKQARVTPLLQKSTLNTPLIENYRPFSLLPFIFKTLERVVFNQVSLFLSQNNKLDTKQSGFRSGHSTETALLSVAEALRIAKADSKSSVLILLDLSAAFDTVNHQILLSTLSSLNITWITLRWFESHWLVFQGGLGRGGIQSTSIGHWGSPGLVSCSLLFWMARAVTVALNVFCRIKHIFIPISSGYKNSSKRTQRMAFLAATVATLSSS